MNDTEMMTPASSPVITDLLAPSAARSARPVVAPATDTNIDSRVPGSKGSRDDAPDPPSSRRPAPPESAEAARTRWIGVTGDPAGGAPAHGRVPAGSRPSTYRFQATGRRRHVQPSGAFTRPCGLSR